MKAILPRDQEEKCKAGVNKRSGRKISAHVILPPIQTPLESTPFLGHSGSLDLFSRPAQKSGQFNHKSDVRIAVNSQHPEHKYRFIAKPAHPGICYGLALIVMNEAAFQVPLEAFYRAFQELIDEGGCGIARKIEIYAETFHPSVKVAKRTLQYRLSTKLTVPNDGQFEVILQYFKQDSFRRRGVLTEEREHELWRLWREASVACSRRRAYQRARRKVRSQSKAAAPGSGV